MQVINAILAAGLAAFNAGHFTEALRDFTEAAKNPSDETAHVFLALTQAATNDCAAALPVLTQHVSDQKLARLAGIAAVKCYAAINDDQHEFEVLARLEKQFPNDEDVLYLAAHQHMKAFNDDTFAMFQRVPSSYRVHQLSAEIFEVENRFDDAISEYRQAIQINPTAPDLHFRLGRAILLQSHSPEALALASEQFQAELKLSPEDAACEFQLGQIAQVQTNTSEAQTHFERAIQLSPDFVQALLALSKLVDRPRAIELLARAAKIQPDNEAIHYSLMTAYRDSGQMEKAKAEKATLDRLQKPADGEFSDFLKKLGQKPPAQP
jgi:tetratricopeptide (TPR) repeat protein